MTQSKITFKLTEELAHKLKGKGQYKDKCYNCGKTFQIGDYIVSKIASCHHGRKWYCINCAKELKIL
jgi:hypothetical protein